MALQGTLDAFCVPDVLRILAATAKTGCLQVEGDRGRGAVWVVDGALVAAHTGGRDGAAPEEAVFELLRFERGSFAFTVDQRIPDAGYDGQDIESTLRRATQLLDEWHGLQAVVPSLSHRVTLVPALATAQVTIDSTAWRALVAVADGRSVDELAQELGLSELGVSRVVRDLVELGVAVVEAPRAARMHVARANGG